MARLRTKCGTEFVVDDDLLPELEKYNWHVARRRKNVYATAWVLEDGVRYKRYLHRLVTNAPKGLLVDHIDRDTKDNRRQNLRLCTPAQNVLNSVERADCTSGYKGVDKYWNKWRARFKEQHLGLFDTKEEAAKARDEAAKAEDAFAYMTYKEK